MDKNENEVKRYFWCKLNEKFFEEDTIAWLEEQENGIFYSNFYLKLCLKTLNTNGILIRNVGKLSIPYDMKKISEITHISLNIVIDAMKIFKRIGLVKILENGGIYLTKFAEMMGFEPSEELVFTKEISDEKDADFSGNIVTKELPKCYTEIEKDIELEKEIEIEIEQEKEKKKDDFGGSSCVFEFIKKFCGNQKNVTNYDLSTYKLDEQLNKFSYCNDFKHNKVCFEGT